MHDYSGLAAAFRRLAAALIGAGLVAGCASTPDNDSHACRRSPAGASTASALATPRAKQPREQAPTARDGARGGHPVLRDDAPRRYVVQEGDTLWGLAATFLENPWRWPRLWAQNPGIDNPNLIYPGETLTLTRDLDGHLRLRPADTKILKPRVRVKPGASAIPAIDPALVTSFIRGDRVVAPSRLDEAPHIVAFSDSRVAGVARSKVYVRGLVNHERQRYQIVRGAGPLTDPESGCELGILARGVGELKINDFDKIATGVINVSSTIAQIGDRLLPLQRRPITRGYQPHPPRVSVAARVIALAGERPVAAQFQILTLNRGARDGLDRGAVLKLFEPGRQVDDPVAGDTVALPAERVGSLMVFETGDHYAFGLVTRSSATIGKGYRARSPRS